MDLATQLNHRMNYLTQRQGILAGNIANASTPGYLAKDLQFAGYLQQAQVRPQVTHPRHQRVGGFAPAGQVTTERRALRLDGNGVQLDTEMLKLNQTQMDFRFVTGLYRKHAQMQRIALGQRGQ